MVAPISGPFSANRRGYHTDGWGDKINTLYLERSWYRQRKPFNLPLRYSFYSARTLNNRGGERLQYSPYNGALVAPYPNSDRLMQRLHNDAYAKFMDKVRGVKATLGATLGEWKSSSSMIEQRATQLWRGYREARRGNIPGMKLQWGPQAGIRTRLRQGGSHVLEYSFGWAPLVKDINSALEVLHNRLPPFKVKVRRSYSGLPVYVYVSSGSFETWYRTTKNFGRELRAYVTVNNPNTALAEQLGLVNLASVLWELTPNSYIVDYFVNVSDFLSSFSDEVGITLGDKTGVIFNETRQGMTRKWAPAFSGLPYSPHSYDYEEVSVSRELGFSGPTLDLRLPWNMSVQRASTSIARLLQQIKGK